MNVHDNFEFGECLLVDPLDVAIFQRDLLHMDQARVEGVLSGGGAEENVKPLQKYNVIRTVYIVLIHGSGSRC